MSKLNRNILPYRDYDEHDVVNEFALNTTGLAGTLVKVTVASPDTEDSFEAYPVGASFGGVTSMRWENPNKVAVCVSGDLTSEILGMTLVDVKELDENNQRLVLGHNDKLRSLDAVLSGQTVPVVTRGLFLLGENAYIGAPDTGRVGVPSDNGKIQVIDPRTIRSNTGDAMVYSPDQVVGKFLSNTGSRQAGYAIFQLNVGAR